MVSSTERPAIHFSYLSKNGLSGIIRTMAEYYLYSSFFISIITLSLFHSITLFQSFSLFPKVKTLRNNMFHAYGIRSLQLESSGGTTDLVAMEFIPTHIKSSI